MKGFRVAALLACLPLATTAIAGQTARIEGRVHDEVTGAPVPDAHVRIVGSSVQARSDREGRYRLTDVPAGLVSVRVEAERYAPLVQHLEIDPGVTVIAPLEISPAAVVLERLMARASPEPPGAGSKRVLGSGKTAEAVTARVPGARVLFTGGAVGTATQILLRGVKSLNLPGEPLYYVDGIHVSPPTAPSARNRAGEPSILDMIDPASIERIEVLSGAAASAAFGLGSNNGVILIYTRR